MSEKYEINEDYFGLDELDETTADCINSSIKAFLVSLGLPFDHCRGQGYDGAQNFQDHVSGVAKRFDNDNQAAISVHSLSCTLCKPVPPEYSKGLQMHQGSFKLHYGGCSAEVFSKKTNNL